MAFTMLGTTENGPALWTDEGCRRRHRHVIPVSINNSMGGSSQIKGHGFVDSQRFDGILDIGVVRLGSMEQGGKKGKQGLWIRLTH